MMTPELARPLRQPTPGLTRRRPATVFLALAATTLVAATALLVSNDVVAAFPERSVKIVVPYSAGGGTDIIARRLAERLHPRLGQAVIVENRVGANGIIGTEYVAKSPPDGYTYVLVVNSHLINPLITRRMPYDTFKDFAPVTMVAKSPLVFVSRADLPVDSPQALAEMVRNDPQGKYTYGSSESMTRLVGAMYVSAQKLDMVHIGYKGGAPLMTDIAGGQVTVGVTSVLTARQLITGGKLRAIGLTGDRRSPVLPDVPTMGEGGLRQFDDVYTSYSLYAPAATPRTALERMQQEIAAIVAAPDMKEILAEQAATGVANPVAEFTAQVDRDAAFWARLAREIDLQPE
jgi:tripartite-type tricarboxylate transporter receptor subunit TctC